MSHLSRVARLQVVIAAVSLAAILAVYTVGPRDPARLALAADLCWIWTAAFATFACSFAARRPGGSAPRRTWDWIGAGCASFLVGQLVWTYYDLSAGAPPPYPSLADVGYLGIQIGLIGGVAHIGRARPTRQLDAELLLDTLLVTFIAGAVAYEFLLEPLFDMGRSISALAASVAWAIGGVAVLWLILIQMLRRTTLPVRTLAWILPGVVTLATTNVVYAVSALRGTYAVGGLLDLGWDAGLLMIAVAAAVAPEQVSEIEPEPRTGRAGTGGGAGRRARAGAVVVGLAGMAVLTIEAALRVPGEGDAALLVGLGILIVGARMVYSLGADRRYAELLEDEVATQTRSLMSSLAATASAERSLRLVMEAVPDAIVVLDREGRSLDSNEAGRRLRAAPTVFAGLDTSAAGFARENLQRAFAGEVQRFEVPTRHDDGTSGMTAVLYAPVREGDRVLKVLALMRDVTDQRRTQAQLQQAEKLAALGQLVSGVAHEINNPAAIISGFAQTLLLDDLKGDQRDTVQMIYDEATRIGRITSNLLAFARAGGRERTLVDINDIVRRTFALRSYHLTTLNITVTLDLDPADPKVWANGSEMQQMLLNFLINAEQALTTVETRRGIVMGTHAYDDRVRLRVADTGPGIPQELLGKIFDPFFTTKPEGMGTGLGLSICYGIVHDHGGRLTVDAEPGCGAVFTVDLPRDQRVQQRISAPVAAPATREDPLSVLVIDDEQALRRAVLRFLERRGIHAVGVADGNEALEALKRGVFDVIVSDVRMPGLNGREFLDRLREYHPAMVRRLIFSTGDTFAPDTAALLQESGLPSLVKPFDFEKLATLIRDVAQAAPRISA